MEIYGGEAGIRTQGPRKGSTVFETAPFNRSGTSPSNRLPIGRRPIFLYPIILLEFPAM